MSYNLIVIISILICAIISYLFSLYLVEFILGKESGFFKFAQLVVAIVSMTTFYAPIKHFMLKYLEIENFDDEKRDD